MAKIAAAMMPGSAVGSTTWRKTCRRVAPSISAASSISIGIERMKAHISHMQNGSVMHT